jgi:hypothetical protein
MASPLNREMLTGPIDAATPTSPRAWRRALQARYPNEYVWFLFVSAMDLIMTSVVLFFGGREANPLANGVLESLGLGGLAVFKFALVGVVIGCCQIIGSQRRRTGLWLARFAVAITAVPMIAAFAQLLVASHAGELVP